jgi:hypothetical protein
LAVCVISVAPVGAATAALVLNPPQIIEANPTSVNSQGTVPADGRLRGQDFTAVVSHVAWPQSVAARSGVDYVAGAGRRLVAFTLSITQPTDESGSLNSETAVTADLRVDGATTSVSLAQINQQISSGSGGSTETTGTDSFVGSVPARAHDVTLSLSEAGFTQAINLWSLRRIEPNPTVLYRDPSASSVAGSAAAPFHLTFTNPADGFSSSDDAQVSSATLSEFAPGGSDTPSDPNQAYLVVGLQSSFPSVPYGQPNSGHFFSTFSPLPGNRLTFTPTGGAAVTGTSSTSAFSSTNAANDDDGIFDALYWFSVPANLTGGTLSMSAGAVTGTEFTGFTGANPVPIDVTAPATVPLTFPTVPRLSAVQRTPPWVGAPLPATGVAAASNSTTGSNPGGGSKGHFPVWEAVLALVVISGIGVLIRQWRHRRAVVAAAVTGPSVEPSTQPPEKAVHPVEPPAQPIQPVVRPAAPPPEPAQTGSDATLRINLLGPLDLGDLRADGVRRIVVELLVYLACHDHRHLRVGQIQIGFRPVGSGRGEIAEKTLRNYLSELRQWVGAEHLPESSAKEGYLLLDIDVDWATFLSLSRQADTSSGADAIALRTDALALVRGRPFEDVLHDGFDWVEAEHLDSQMAGAIAACVVNLATDLLEAKNFAAALEAAWAGRRGAADDAGPWLVGAQAIAAQGDRSALKRWMTDASRHLDPEDMARISDSLDPDHEPPPER